MHLRRGLAVALAVPVAFAALSISVPMADASIGVGLEAAPVRLGSVAQPGGSYALPPVYVIDTGTQAESIEVQVQRLSTGPGRDVPQSWVHMTGPGVRLSPSQSDRIPLELVVPGSARSGRYLSDIVVTGSAGISPGQANFGAAAAVPLEFSVKPGPPPGLWPLVPTWTWWFAAGLLLLVAAGLGFSRSGVRIRILIDRPPTIAPSAARRDRARWSLRAAIALISVAGLAACSTAPSTPAGTPGGSSSITIKLNVVPTLVKATVSPSSATFGNCTGGNTSLNISSTSGALGFPNGICWLGKAGPAGSYPITVTNTGVAATIDVSGGNAVPSDGLTPWGLCNLGSNPAAACTGAGGKPGNDQYVVQNFAAGGMNPAGLTGSGVCDTEFAAGSCSALRNDAQQEGVKLTGPVSSDDHSISWTVMITWTAVYLANT
jgi:hypothetical protein